MGMISPPIGQLSGRPAATAARIRIPAAIQQPEAASLHQFRRIQRLASPGSILRIIRLISSIIFLSSFLLY